MSLPIPSGVYGTRILPNSLHRQHLQLIDDLLASCSVSCEFVFGGVDIQCSCSGAPALASPENFCTLCNGRGTISTEEKVCIPLAIEFQGSRFQSSAGKRLQITEGFAETMCRIELLPHIKSAEYVVLDACNACYSNNRYKVAGTPEFCGLGRNTHVVVLWERIA